MPLAREAGGPDPFLNSITTSEKSTSNISFAEEDSVHRPKQPKTSKT